MSRAPGLTLGIAIPVLLLMAAPAGAECAPGLDVTEMADATLLVEMDAPCHPYHAVRIAYAGLTIVEETSDTGKLALKLPRLEDTLSLNVELGALRLTSEVPSASGLAGRVIAVDWPDGDRLGHLGATLAGSGSERRFLLGFTAQTGNPHLEILQIPEGASAYLELPVDETTCGRSIVADLAVSNAPPVPLRVTLPACNSAATTLRLAL